MTDSGVHLGEETSNTLLEGIRSENSEKWQRFVRIYGPLIRHWCRKWDVRQEDAEDICQEVFGKVNRAIGSFTPDGRKAPFRRWLKTIAANAMRDAIRRMPPGGEGEGGSDAYMASLERAEVFPEENDDDNSEEDERELLRGVIDEVLSRCAERNRRAFIQVVIEGKSPADVANDLGMTTNAVYLAVSHIKNRIRKELEGMSDSE